MIKRLFLAFLILAMTAAGAAWWFYLRLTTPFQGYETNEVFVDIPAGTSEGDIARRLADAGVVRDAWTFRIAARHAGADRKLQAGEYRFSGPATPADVVARIARGDAYTRGVTFPEGLTIREMASIFERSGLGAADGFVAATANTSLAGSFDPDATTLEGYLFPSTYAVARGGGAEGVVSAMVEQFKIVFDAAHRAAADAQGLTIREAVTLASLVEKETAQPEERPLVAAVYLNRLRVHMPLQCDPTVVYALMLAGRWNGNISKADLSIDSPFNTYRYAGLPPGPIASPGRGSLDAAVHPSSAPYLYFVSRNNGTHVFATTLDEHNRNVARWQPRRK